MASQASTTRTHKRVAELDGAGRRAFTHTLLGDLRALERMLAEGLLETGVHRVGAEQELFIVDKSWHPAPGALPILGQTSDPHFTTELGQFQLELNADPQLCRGDGLVRMERQIEGLLTDVRRIAADLGLQTLITGILPTIKKSDLGLGNMVPSQRYEALNRAMNELRRGAPYEFSIKGMDELMVKHDSVMVEACNASFQVHLQIDPPDFARMYNLAQVVVAPLLAVAANSPLLFGKRLWAETRIALFQQAVETRRTKSHLREAQSRVTFGKRWVKESILEIYREDVARFRALLGPDTYEDPFAVLDRGEIPELHALRLHNGSIYRWNRACYGIYEGKPHLRIENRVLPAGPSLPDEMANAALWLGVMSELGAGCEDVTRMIDFDQAEANFYGAAREGLSAHFTWLNGEEISADRLILDQLLPTAEAGLRREGVDEDDIKRYLGILDTRARTGRTGARWLTGSLASMRKVGKGGLTRAPMGTQLNALVAATIERQSTGRPVAEWDHARLDEAGGTKNSALRAEQFMNTDLHTVGPEDPVELVTNLMAWEQIRHVPVEDEDHKLIGLVSAGAVARFQAGHSRDEDSATVPVSRIMRTDVFTVTPATPTQEAIAFMRRFKVGCLPVVDEGGRLVGMLTEQNFVDMAASLLEGEPAP